MSAIGGIYNIHKKSIDREVSGKFMEELGKYPSDRRGKWYGDYIFLGCEEQFVTPESAEENIPLSLKRSGLTITADAIIDNREELFNLLGVDSYERKNIGDSLLILMAYEKWSVNCVKYFAGDFAVAIWDEREERLFCARDQVGKRNLYYVKTKDTFAFSTLLKPLLSLKIVEGKLNDTWIGDFLGIPAVTHLIDSHITLYEDIMHLPPAHIMVIQNNGIKLERYWKVDPKNKLVLNSDEEYEEKFREVFFQAVKCRMRSIKPIGVLMSGGLDSASVACIAGKEILKGKGNIYSFSSVPANDYTNYISKTRIGDETPYIKSVGEEVKNIHINLCSFPDKNPLNVIDKLIDIFEQPYKTLENSYWMNGIIEEASSKGIGVLLDGQSGNATVSWGNFLPASLTYLSEGNLASFIREIWYYSKLHNRNPLRLTMSIVKNYLPYSALEALDNVRGKENPASMLVPINPEFAANLNLSQRFKEFHEDIYFLKNKNSFHSRMMMLGDRAFTHIAVVESKQSLAYSVCRRDPTRDKRLIEFCMSLPEDQYVRKGRERSLIRRAMKGILPDKIRLNETKRGLQAADWVQRIIPYCEDIKEEILSNINNDAVKKYLDTDKILKEMNKIDINSQSIYKENFGMRLIMRSLIFIRFLNGIG